MGNSITHNDTTDRFRIIASSKNWIEEDAIAQLRAVAKRRNVIKTVGMPDLHPGKLCPVGTAILTQDLIYPDLVGNDIGCGMGIWATGLKTRKFKLEKATRKLFLEEPYTGGAEEWLERGGLKSDLFSYALGTIGGGNHFAELQAVETIFNQKYVQNIGIDVGELYLLVHSGSRGLGQLILDHHQTHFGLDGLDVRSDAGTNYLIEHDQAVKWAAINRALIAHRFTQAIKADSKCLFDHTHNGISPMNDTNLNGWLHRKGASPGDNGMLVIPGSRGTLSYLVRPTDKISESLYSLAHGAGRKWTRSSAKAKLEKNFTRMDLMRTKLGGHVICEDKSLIFEEAPQAYKNIDVVISDLVDAELVDVIATLRPVLTYKTRANEQGARICHQN